MVIMFTENEYELIKDAMARCSLHPSIFGMTDENKSIVISERKLIAYITENTTSPVKPYYDKMKKQLPVGGIKSRVAKQVVTEAIEDLRLPKGIFIKH